MYKLNYEYHLIELNVCFSHLKDVNAAKAFADEAANILDRAIIGPLCRNALLYFAYADFEEGRMKYDKVHQMYNKFISIPDVDPTLVIQTKYFYKNSIKTKTVFHLFIDLCSIHEICSTCRRYKISTYSI